ncbi:MAG: ATP-dependent sacrificial sulfur transferase LarE [Candidatus Omnitrophica bacterium]|nr:ATP-dependent sacrificial sulfur transferase LarE [Candidatus Omnitrophota bacterium]
MKPLDPLKEIIHSYGRVLVAFSGGADSAFVLKICRDVLGPENVKPVIAKSPSLPQSELEAARCVAGEIGAEFLVIETRELENPEYAANSTRRCYFCKGELYSCLLPLAEKFGMQFVVNGINRDDLGDWRPGLRAAREYGIKSPLVEAEFGKEEIRFYSRQLGLSTWSKPQAACLSSRIPFGTKVTADRLRQIETGEETLKAFGFRTVRLRWMGRGGLSNLPSASVEVGQEEVGIFFQNQEIRESVTARLRQLGFKSIDLELAGYRPGRFNPTGL